MRTEMRTDYRTTRLPWPDPNILLHGGTVTVHDSVHYRRNGFLQSEFSDVRLTGMRMLVSGILGR